LVQVRDYVSGRIERQLGPEKYKSRVIAQHAESKDLMN
jgi:hypothetical protein